MASLHEWLDGTGLWKQVVLSTVASELLEAMQPLPDLQGDAGPLHEGQLQLGIQKNPLGALALSLTLPVKPREYVLSLEGPAGARTGFRLAVDLTDGGLQRTALGLLDKLPGFLLKPAQLDHAGAGPGLEPAGGAVTLEHDGLWLVIKGNAGQPVTVTLSANRLPPDGLVRLKVVPPMVLVADTGFGLELPEGLWIDDSTAGRAGGTSFDSDGQPVHTDADDDAWHGIVIRKLRFHLPKGVPLLGGHAIDGYLQVGMAPTPGIEVVLRAKIPADGDRPPLNVLIECRDPTATGLDGLVPTYAEISMDLPWPRQKDMAGALGPFKVGGGQPVKARARFARAAATAQQLPRTVMTLALESQGPEGLLAVDSRDGDMAAKVVVTAATTASALAADGHGPALHKLLTVAVGLSNFLHGGRVVVHSAQLLAEGEATPIDGTYTLAIDYSVDAVVDTLGFDLLEIRMKPERPLKLRARDVRLTVDPTQNGVDMFKLDFNASRLEVEDPGGWQVGNLGDLFDVAGTRGGRGSQWFEIDLRFRVDLGPVRVSGATLRATFDGPAAPKISLRGLDAAVDLRPLIRGEGGVQLHATGFSASLAVNLLPLGGLGARGEVSTDGPMVKLSLGVEFPGPLPLANSGLALYALGGVFAANGQPRGPAPGADPVQHQLDWHHADRNAFAPASAFSFGVEAVVGTAPDMGFSFSARAGLFIRTPDVALRGALDGRVLQPRITLARDGNAGPGIRARGVIVVDPADAVTVAVEGTYKIPHLLDVAVPFSARFPTVSEQLNQWYVHLGADGYPGEGRDKGPVRATLLPGLLDQQADAYVMFRGHKITAWPRAEPWAQDWNGFLCAFGAGFTCVWGVKPVLWAELHARADVMLGTAPLALAGSAAMGGSLHATVFAVGVDATLEMLVMADRTPWIKAEVCGHIELLLKTLRRCVRIELGNPFTPEPPVPAESPLDGPQHLVDDRYQVIAPLVATREELKPANVVWPDAIPLITFGNPPDIGALAAPQFPMARVDPFGPRAAAKGDERLRHEWAFVELTLLDVTNPSAPTTVPGTFSSVWLHGKFDEPNKRPQPAELALLTPDAGLWMNALGDAGAGLPHRPLSQLADVCRLSAHALPGLAVAQAARPINGGSDLLMPPHPVSPDPLKSQPCVVFSSRIVNPATPETPHLDEAWAATQTWPVLVRAAGLVPVEPALPLQEVSLRMALDPGGLEAPTVGSIQGVEMRHAGMRQKLRFEAREPMTAVRLWLRWPGPAPAPVDMAGMSIAVSDEHQRAWHIDRRMPLAEGAEAIGWSPPNDVRMRVIIAEHALDERWQVLAVEGVTDSARAAADAQNLALQAEAERQRQAEQKGPPTGSAPVLAGRCVLRPKRDYELRIRLKWTATLRYLDQGTEKVNSRSGERIHSWFWRTAPTATPVNTPAAEVSMLRQRPWQRTFEPAMLTRHLRGIEPAQAESSRFANDPAQIFFGVAHVGALLAAYGLELRVRVRRVDQPDPSATLGIVKRPAWHWAEPDAWMNPAEAARAAARVGSACALPGQQATATVPLSLTVRATYELGMEVRRKSEPLVSFAHKPDWIAAVTFTTSRWRDAVELQQACGFGTGLAGRPIGHALGDAALCAPQFLQPVIAHGDDGILQQWLTEQAMDGWPAPDQPRVTGLWRRSGDTWLWVGILLESPEPLQRPGRLSVGTWGLRSGSGAVSMPFDIQLSDSTGTRWLLACTVPPALRHIRVGNRRLPPRVRMILIDRPMGAATPIQRVGWLELAMQPSFAQEPL